MLKFCQYTAPGGGQGASRMGAHLTRNSGLLLLCSKQSKVIGLKQQSVYYSEILWARPWGRAPWAVAAFWCGWEPGSGVQWLDGMVHRVQNGLPHRPNAGPFSPRTHGPRWPRQLSHLAQRGFSHPYLARTLTGQPRFKETNTSLHGRMLKGLQRSQIRHTDYIVK